VRFCLIASKPTDSVIFGVLPAAARLGLEVMVLTDRPEDHKRALAHSARLPRPGCPRPQPERDRAAPAPQGPPVQFVGCDVWDARELIGAIAARPAPHAIASNSDHLQTQTALAADYFGLPGQDWRAALRAKDKVLMRHRLAQTGAEHVAAAEVTPGGSRPELSYPAVLKPARGYALTYWPLRHPGDHISLTHTNRDYLGVICALGPEPAAVERAIRDLRTSGSWEIAAEVAP
jgi:hypothetical protein